MRILLGALIAGVVLYVVPGTRSGPACLIAGFFSTYVLVLTGPRSVVERMGILLSVAIVAWVAGPRAAYGQSFWGHLAGWTAASAALAYYLRPKSE